jgi:hypothetical protein
MVQTLSAEPGVGAQLSLPVKVQLPAKWNFLGTTADFMVTVGRSSYFEGVNSSDSWATSHFIHWLLLRRRRSVHFIRLWSSRWQTQGHKSST